MTYTIDFVRNYPTLVLNGKRVFVDLGFPSALGEFEFMGTHYKEPTIRGPFNLTQISKDFGCQIDGMIGLKCLRNFMVKVDYANATLTVEKSLPVSGDGIRWESNGWDIRLNVEVDGQNHLMALDSGSEICYAASQLTAGKTAKDTFTDNAGGNKPFTTNVYDMPVSVEGISLTMPFGNLPASVEEDQIDHGMYGTIGAPFFKQKVLIFNFPENKLYIE